VPTATRGSSVEGKIVAVPDRDAGGNRLSAEQRVAFGKAARANAALESHADFRRLRARDPVALLLGGAETRVPELVPIRHGRMLVSPFTFYRGAALVMAADLATTPTPTYAPSCAGMPTCPTSARMPRRSGAWSSTSMISMRRCPVRSNGTSSDWPRASWWHDGTTA
jgi:Uncharacterized protein conserved in bacteria (DUF2252)